MNELFGFVKNEHFRHEWIAELENKNKKSENHASHLNQLENLSEVVPKAKAWYKQITFPEVSKRVLRTTELLLKFSVVTVNDV